MMTTATPLVGQSRPPRQILLAQLTAPMRRFLLTESGSAGLLLAATALALAWANSSWSDLYAAIWAPDVAVRLGGAELSMDLRHWVNDGLIALFFFFVGPEGRREVSVGELTDRRRLVVPAIGAVGGMIVPALLYLVMNPTGEAARGWG